MAGRQEPPPLVERPPQDGMPHGGARPTRTRRTTLLPALKCCPLVCPRPAGLPQLGILCGHSHHPAAWRETPGSSWLREQSKNSESRRRPPQLRSLKPRKEELLTLASPQRPLPHGFFSDTALGGQAWLTPEQGRRRRKDTDSPWPPSPSAAALLLRGERSASPAHAKVFKHTCGEKKRKEHSEKVNFLA